MSTTLVVDEHAVEEAEAQIRYYVEHAGPHIALRFAAEIEAIYQGLEEDRITGVNHPRARFRIPIKRVLLDRFPFAVAARALHGSEPADGAAAVSMPISAPSARAES